MKTKKHVSAAALAAFMLTGAAQAWIMPEPTQSYYSSSLAVTKDRMDNGDGSSILDTKFFLPVPTDPGVTAAAEQQHRELLALLTTYERR